jgi:hypothetical protein
LKLSTVSSQRVEALRGAAAAAEALQRPAEALDRLKEAIKAVPTSVTADELSRVEALAKIAAARGPVESQAGPPVNSTPAPVDLPDKPRRLKEAGNAAYKMGQFGEAEARCVLHPRICLLASVHTAFLFCLQAHLSSRSRSRKHHHHQLRHRLSCCHLTTHTALPSFPTDSLAVSQVWRSHRPRLSRARAQVHHWIGHALHQPRAGSVKGRSAATMC